MVYKCSAPIATLIAKASDVKQEFVKCFCFLKNLIMSEIGSEKYRVNTKL